MGGSKQTAQDVEQLLLLRHNLLDRQLVDIDGVHCGNVDDVEVALVDGSWRITALLVGPGVVTSRMHGRSWRWISNLFGDRMVSLPWSSVERVSAAVHLAYPASAFGLQLREDRTIAVFDRILGRRGPSRDDVLAAPPIERGTT